MGTSLAAVCDKCKSKSGLMIISGISGTSIYDNVRGVPKAC